VNRPLLHKYRATSVAQRLVFDGITFGIFEIAGEDHDQVDDGPDTAATECEQLRHADACMARVEAMHAKAAEKPAEQEGDQPTIVVLGWPVLAGSWIGTAEDIALLCIAIGAKLAWIGRRPATGRTRLLFQCLFNN
jgi:hypothetical protein